MDKSTGEEQVADAVFVNVASQMSTTDPLSRGYEMNGVRSMDTQ